MGNKKADLERVRARGHVCVYVCVNARAGDQNKRLSPFMADRPGY